MTKLITSDSYKFGQKNVLPYVGEVEISLVGIIEVEDSVADKIVEAEIGFNFLPKTALTPIIPETASTSTPIVPEKEYKNADGTDMTKEQVEHQQLIDSLDTLKVAELKELCKELPEAEWKTLKQKELTEYLKGKL